jgi:hypothetical protein
LGLFGLEVDPQWQDDFWTSLFPICTFQQHITFTIKYNQFEFFGCYDALSLKYFKSTKTRPICAAEACFFTVQQ